MAPGVELFLWCIVFAIPTAIVCTVLNRLITYDTTNFDLEFVWDNKYSREQLEL
ncbi:hypothetical protein [Paenibacillus hamazuiensis]|uniref:hypothetical protein n=1 Tax=Paenibacillus hamazuiensis TaxID=2936508 RepID=UPI00200FE9DB|nr:hypothetical protein [Paenibacillus hamazuiensis]